MAIQVPSSAVVSQSKVEGGRRLLAVGIVAPLLFASVFLLDGLIKPRYSAYTEDISYLELGANGWIQRANFIVFGALLIAFLLGYAWRMRPILGQRWLYAAAAALLLSDLGWIMAGLFVPNAFGSPQYRGHGVLHQIASATVFLPLALACLLLGARLVRVRRWRGYGLYCLIFGLVQLVYPVGTLAYLINPIAFGNVNSPNDGLIQRIVVIGGPIAWYLISAVVALRRTGAAAGQA